MQCFRNKKIMSLLPQAPFRQFFVAAGFLTLLSRPGTAAPMYTVEALGMPALAFSTSQDINDSGQITGAGYTSSGAEWHAFRSGDKAQDLGTLGGTSSGGFGINAAGQVTGYATVGGNQASHAFLYDGKMHDLGTLGGANSIGYSINGRGEVTGDADTNYSTYPFRYVHAFLYDGTMHNLGTPGPPYIGSVGTSVNDNGDVVGYAWTSSDFSDHAFLYDGTMHDLGTLGGAVSLGFGVNARIQVTGVADTRAGNAHAFLYDGSMHDLGTLGGATSTGISINNDGLITGSAATSDGTGLHAFLYDHTMLDLNTLLSPADPLYGRISLDQGRKITDAGQILVSGTGPDGYQTFLLTPLADALPEPGCLVILCSGWLAMASLRHLHSQRSGRGGAG